MNKIKVIYHWIIGMLLNIFCDFLIMLWGIFSKETRKLYIERFFPQYLKTEVRSNEQLKSEG